jgi:tRNA 2-selenouridine synthase
LEVPISIRVENIVSDYGFYEKEKLISSLHEISRRLGGLNTKIANEFIENNQLEKACEIILKYYDKAYLHGLSKREDINNIYYLEINNTDENENSERIIKLANIIKTELSK